MEASAGANLAAVTCIRAKEKNEFNPYKQILVYPYLDVDNTGKNRPKIIQSLPDSALKLFKECYCTKEYTSKDPYIYPVYANENMLKNLPEAYIVTCGKDNLYIDGKKYAELLKRNGVKVVLKHYEEAMHGFIENASSKNYFSEESSSNDNIQIKLAKKAAEELIEWVL